MTPDDQAKPLGPDESASETVGNTALAPVQAKSITHGATALPHIGPVIYDITSIALDDPDQYLAKACAMGFNAILCNNPSEELICNSHSRGLQVYLTLDISTMHDEKLAVAHPDWFVATPSGPKFVYLSETDSAVSWWDKQITRWADKGVAGFFCHEVAAAPASVWGHIIGNALASNNAVQFIASTPGCTPAEIASLCGCGFTFSVSSSCWWDYAAGWLNDETERLVRLAVPIALACQSPHHSAFPQAESHRRRALALAAIFSVGWIMPCGFEATDRYNLQDYIVELNRLRASTTSLSNAPPAAIISSTGADIAAIIRGGDLMMVANASPDRPSQLNIAGYARYISHSGVSYTAADGEFNRTMSGDGILPPANFRLFHIRQNTPIVTLKKTMPDCGADRIAIEKITPQVDGGAFPVRRIIGETLTIEADIITDGHDKLAAEILFRPITETKWQSHPMYLLGNDRWRGEVTLPTLGRYIYAIRAWKDIYATFIDELTKKHEAGINIHLELIEGESIIDQTIKANTNKFSKSLAILQKKLAASSDAAKRSILLSDQMKQLMHQADIKKFAVLSPNIIVDAERLGARFANWYEVFPRSQSGDPNRHGNFNDVIAQLPRIASMGFDVLYFPPIHPIGKINRKGRNNTLTPTATDPGSPYAIGNEHGGHDAIHPELGSFEDFQMLTAEAARHGIELALDFAIQCAPDHPWLKQHKDWFDWRPDGSLRYAENPPKKYEDIVNVDFYAKGATPSLWLALRDIVEFWVDHGIKLFRVDNPHTKPLPFWEWLINDIRSRHPEVIFLAEAFTRPKVMYRLAKIGFSQSYTYFTWRNTKAELQDYLTELTTTPPKEFFRPHFFVNTPDINPQFLHNSGRAGFLIRAALAATLSGLWGVYNGFELCESKAVSGKEEYLDSEKYQIRVWDHNAPGNIIAEISQLNKIRRANAALHSHLNVEFHTTPDDDVIFFSKAAADGNIVFVAISLDPFNTHQTTLELPYRRLGLPDGGSIIAHDLMRDYQFIWHGKYQPVTLHPDQPFCIWRVQKLRA